MRPRHPAALLLELYRTMVAPEFPARGNSIGARRTCLVVRTRIRIQETKQEPGPGSCHALDQESCRGSGLQLESDSHDKGQTRNRNQGTVQGVVLTSEPESRIQD